MEKGLFIISANDFMAYQSKLAGLDYEAKLSGDGRSAYVVVRDCKHYTGDPISYVAKIFGQAAAKACC